MRVWEERGLEGCGVRTGGSRKKSIVFELGREKEKAPGFSCGCAC